MSLFLTADDLARCEHTSRVMLSPLSAPSLDDWRREVGRSLCHLFRADRFIFGLASEEGYLCTENIGAETVEGFRFFLEEPLTRGTPAPDPLVDRFMNYRRTNGLEAYTHAVVDHVLDGRARESRFHREVAEPGGLHHLHALHVTDTAAGDAGVALYFERPKDTSFGEGGLMLLRALSPAFKAGLEALARLHAHRDAMDRLEEPLAVFDVNGRELYRNRACVDLLAADPEAHQVVDVVRLLARSLASFGFPQTPLAAVDTPIPTAEREVRTRKNRYRLRGSFVGTSVFGGAGSVMVTLSPASGPALPTEDALRERYGLTRREAEVALLLAEGLTNDQVADRLFVSPHTARRHTEQVLSKVGLNSRKALALKLLQG